MENNMDFSVVSVDTTPVHHDNSEVQAGCWGDTGTGRYC